MKTHTPNDGEVVEAPSREFLEDIRRALSRREKATSLRGTAREIGMSPTGLRGLIDGVTPYGKTVSKMLEWFARYGADVAGEAEVRRVALEQLTRTIAPAELREGLVEAIGYMVEHPSAELLERVRAVLEPPSPEPAAE